MRIRPRSLAVGAAAIAAVGVAASVVLPLIPAWPFVLFEHFRFQYVCVGGLIAIACSALRMWGWFDTVLIATLVNALWIVPDLSRSTRPLPDGMPMRVLLLNVHTSSTSFADVRKLLDDVRPDVVGLVEVDARWLAELAPALTAYPQRIEQPRNDNFGVALYAKQPLTGAGEELGSLLPTIVATLDMHGTRVDIVLTHPIPPVGGAALASQVSQLSSVAKRVHTLGSSTIVMGDLNATPWSRPFRDFASASGLCDSRAGFGLQASFPAAAAVLRVPIDHVFVSCSIGVRSREIGRDVGSDHLPVIIELVIPTR